jgi:hypothetical protein
MITPKRGIMVHIVKTLPIPEVMTAISSSAGINKRIPRTSAPSIWLKISGISEPDPGK